MCTISHSERIGQSTVDEQTRPQTDKKYKESTDENGGGEQRVGPMQQGVCGSGYCCLDLELRVVAQIFFCLDLGQCKKVCRVDFMPMGLICAARFALGNFFLLNLNR